MRSPRNLFFAPLGMMKLFFLLSIFFATVLSAQERKVALVIGNNAYPDVPLRNAVSDAESVAAFLKEKAGFAEENVLLRRNIDREQFFDAYETFVQRAQGAGIAFIYYAGHGMESLRGDKNYLVPVNARVKRLAAKESSLRSEGINMTQTIEDLEEELPAGAKLVVLDCCRERPAKRSSGRSQMGGGMHGMRKDQIPEGTLVLFAAAPGRLADDAGLDGSQQGPLTKALLENFAHPRKDLLDASWDTAAAVEKATHEAQIPYVEFSGRPGLLRKINFVTGAPVSGERSEDFRGEGTDLQQRAQWQERMREMAGDYSAAEKLGTAEAWQIFLAAYQGLANPYSDRDEEMLAVARERSVRPAMAGKRAGEEREFEIAPGVKMKMCWIPATTSAEWKRLKGKDTFTMGSPESEEVRRDDERQHEVKLTRGYWMGKYEVTQAEWMAVMGENPSHFAQGGQLPVEQVSWDDCQKFIAGLSQVEEVGWAWTLPSEAQWEYACRGGSDGVFGLADGSGDYGVDYLSAKMANFDGDYPYGGAAKREYRGKTLPVGSFSANAWGLCDMHGNVWEWIDDWYGPYQGEQAMDSVGPSGGSYRVYRGGGWNDSAAYCRSAVRSRGSPTNRYLGLGFRVVLQSQQARKQ